MSRSAAQELRETQQVERWLCAGLCLARTARPSAELLQQVVPWVRACVEQSASLPPAGMIADVGRLLCSGQLTLVQPPAVGPELRGALRAYEDGVLGRLAAEARFEAAADAVARLAGRQRPEAVAVVMEQLLQQLGCGEMPAVSPAVARRVLARPAGELLEAGLAGLRQGEGQVQLEAQLAPRYRQLARLSRHAEVLLTDWDVFTLENLQLLSGMTQRVAAQQMVQAAQLLERPLPRRLRRRGGRRGGTPTRVEDESAYPTGGFASITNAGSLENIVSSELVYMDDGGEFDLFDVRFAEAELLYYSRDESVHLRNQRLITVLLGPDLIAARFKDPDLPWQRLVLALGLLLCAVRRLHDWLSEEALLIRLVFLAPGGQCALADERELCQLLLREWVERGSVQIEQAEPAELDLALQSAVLTLRAGEAVAPPPTEQGGGGGPHPVVLDLSQATPQLLAPGLGRSALGQPDSALEAWHRLTRALLEELL